MTSNKRKQDRVALDIYMNKYVAGVPYMTRTSDISREGVGLAHLIEPDMHGRRVGLQFQLPGSEEVIYADGEVVRVAVARHAADTRRRQIGGQLSRRKSSRDRSF